MGVLCCCCCFTCARRLASNILAGYDLDGDGQLSMKEVGYVMDEFCGELLFECRCPKVHNQEVSNLAGLLSILETITQIPVRPCRSAGRDDFSTAAG
eukprot:5860813-Prymnesium_polylepis.1